MARVRLCTDVQGSVAHAPLYSWLEVGVNEALVLDNLLSRVPMSVSAVMLFYTSSVCKQNQAVQIFTQIIPLKMSTTSIVWRRRTCRRRVAYFCPKMSLTYR
jgi:hypothetical protein